MMPVLERGIRWVLFFLSFIHFFFCDRDRFKNSAVPDAMTSDTHERIARTYSSRLGLPRGRDMVH